MRIPAPAAKLSFLQVCMLDRIRARTEAVEEVRAEGHNGWVWIKGERRAATWGGDGPVKLLWQPSKWAQRLPFRENHTRADAAAISRALRRLERRGLVRVNRVRGRGNRTWTVVLTDLGRAVAIAVWTDEGWETVNNTTPG